MARYVRYKIARAVKMKLENVRITAGLNEVMLKRHLHSMMPLKVSINVEKDRATAAPFGERAKPSTAASAAATKAKPVEAGGKASASVQKKEAESISAPKADAKDSKKS